MAKKCTKCQTENPEDAQFCKGCGAPLPKTPEAVPTRTAETAQEELTTGSSFAGRYQIIEELGKGGMGKIYKVLDKETNEKITLKLIKPEIASDKETIQRFRNELITARKVSHRNVCRMYDLNKEKENYYITMEYVSGENLKAFIRRAAPLSTAKTISVAKQICEGLMEAHKLGVIHRDLKPSNIMVDEAGDVRIMDFGIARSLKSKGLTGSGVMIGTPEYMSPEQVEGKGVDKRSDIYSLGVILYEMATGRAPFEGETPFAIGMKHKGEKPPEPKEINPQVSDDLNRLILKCLEKEKEKRFQSAGEVRSELNRIEQGLPLTEKEAFRRKPTTSREINVTFSPKKIFIPSLLVAILIITALAVWSPWTKKQAVPVLQDKPSIAVLPFADLSPQKDQEYFCDGLVEELINRLTNISNLRVPARASSFSFKGKDVGIQEIGQRLDVETVLDGSVRKAGDKLRITVQLVKAEDGYPVWSQVYEGTVEDTFALQDDISLAILDNLKVKLLGGEKEKLVKRHTENMDAYNLYLRGRFFWHKRNEEALMKAIESFEQALEIDPDYTMAYMGLADTYVTLPYYSPVPAKEAYPKAKNAIFKALSIDDRIAEAYAGLGSIKEDYDYDLKGAEEEYQRSLEINPGNANVHHWYALYLRRVSRFEEALREIERALELDPLSLVINRNLGTVLYYSRQYDRAIEAFKKTMDMAPDFSEAHAFLGLTYLEKSMYDQALKEIQKEKEVTKGRHPMVDCWIGIVYMRMGKTQKAREILEDMLKRSHEADISPCSLGTLYLILGEKEQGFRWMEKAYEERAVYTLNMNIFPYFDPIRSDPRFQAILEKIGLK